MKLLIKRDPTQLMKTEGRVELDSSVPRILRNPRVVPDFEVNKIQERSDDDLIIAEKEDYSEIDNHLQITNRQQKNLLRRCFDKITLTGVWSGYRSVLVSNGNGGLYRLKGISFNPERLHFTDYDDGSWEVFGAQPLQSARFEKTMSDNFNKVLENEGIVPIMNCKGYWHYQKKARGRKLAASVVEVEGDTRLDEFMFLVENYFVYRANGFGKERINVNNKGATLGHVIKDIYHDIGFAVGRLKKLMDKNNQTWSTDSDRNNAHIGNVVLYNGGDKVNVGFVDFDASCDNKDYSKSKLRALQKREYKSIVNSANARPISLRTIQIGFLRYNEAVGLFPFFRESFVEGFESGYEEEKRTGIRTSEIAKGIDFSRFLEVFEVLRDNCRLIPEPVQRTMETIIDRRGGLEDLFYGYNIYKRYKEDYLEKKINYKEKSLEDYMGKGIKNIYNILDKNRNYQKEINSYI